MPQSTFFPEGLQLIDGVSQTYAPAWSVDVGGVYAGGAKSALRRGLARFNVFGVASDGRALTIADTLTDARLLVDVIGVAGAMGWSASVERISRADWDYTAANWNIYKTASNWTAAGGDVATPPPAAGFASPAALGATTIDGLLPFVTDAIANRAGAVLLRIKADNETPGSTQFFSIRATQTFDTRLRLRVTYAARDPAPIDRPHAGSMRADRAAASARTSSPTPASSPTQPHAQGSRTQSSNI